MRGALARYRHRMPFLLSWITAWWRACPTNFSISFFLPFPCALLALTQSILQGHDERPTVCIHWDGICDSHVPGVHSKTAAYLQIRAVGRFVTQVRAQGSQQYVAVPQQQVSYVPAPQTQYVAQQQPQTQYVAQPPQTQYVAQQPVNTSLLSFASRES